MVYLARGGFCFITTFALYGCIRAAAKSISDVIPLLDGHGMPSFGLGVYMVKPGEEAYNTVKSALELGYRMVDTAQMYGNEADVGSAIRDSGIPREQLFVQSKLNTDSHGFDKTVRSVRKSVKKMGLEYLDSFLVHSPYGGKLVETWDALILLQNEGLIRSIGVSNYDQRHIEALEMHGRPLPVVNQIEMHPLILAERQSLLDYCKEKGILVQAYGSIFFGRTEKLEDPRVVAAVKNHPGKTAAQVLLRWGLQKGFQLIPKSVKHHRLEENMNIFDFHLSDADVASLDSMQGKLDAYWNPVADADVDLGEVEKHKQAPKSEL